MGYAVKQFVARFCGWRWQDLVGTRSLICGSAFLAGRKTGRSSATRGLRCRGDVSLGRVLPCGCAAVFVAVHVAHARGRRTRYLCWYNVKAFQQDPRGFAACCMMAIVLARRDGRTAPPAPPRLEASKFFLLLAPPCAGLLMHHAATPPPPHTLSCGRLPATIDCVRARVHARCLSGRQQQYVLTSRRGSSVSC